jgi:hypothetical protein
MVVRFKGVPKTYGKNLFNKLMERMQIKCQNKISINNHHGLNISHHNHMHCKIGKSYTLHNVWKHVI